MKKILLLLAAITTLSLAADAPFGFKWGQKINLSDCYEVTETKGLTICSTNNIPKPSTQFDVYNLVLHKNRLIKMIALGVTIKADPYGTEGARKYRMFLEMLTKKYGEPTKKVAKIGLTLYTEPDEVYQCLKYPGCGDVTAFWTEGPVVLALELEGFRRGEGYIKLSYEGPEWDKIIKKVRAADNSATEEVL